MSINKFERIIQVNGFSVKNTIDTKCDYMIVGVTNIGRVIITTGDGKWADISPKKEFLNE